MRRLTISLTLVAIVVLGTTAGGQARGDGWAGSQYSKQDCSRVAGNGRPGLYCERWVKATVASTQTIQVDDETCPTTSRLVSRTGTIEETFKRYDFYDGPMPVVGFAVVGNETGYDYTWVEYTETDLGCL